MQVIFGDSDFGCYTGSKEETRRQGHDREEKLGTCDSGTILTAIFSEYTLPLLPLYSYL